MRVEGPYWGAELPGYSGQGIRFVNRSEDPRPVSAALFQRNLDDPEGPVVWWQVVHHCPYGWYRPLGRHWQLEAQLVDGRGNCTHPVPVGDGDVLWEQNGRLFRKRNDIARGIQVTGSAPYGVVLLKGGWPWMQAWFWGKHQRLSFGWSGEWNLALFPKNLRPGVKVFPENVLSIGAAPVHRHNLTLAGGRERPFFLSWER